MGGIGSGNTWRSAKTTCEASLRIDVRYMLKHGLLKPGRRGRLSWNRYGEPSGSIGYEAFSDCLVIDYRARLAGRDWESITERIPIDHAAQPFGGTRPYLRCLRCGRRCLVLYGGLRFRCRRCQRLSYQSQRGDAVDRAVLQIRKICEQLGTRFPDEFDLLPPKPKHMHWRTYDRLAATHERYCRLYNVGIAGLMAQFEALSQRKR